LTTRGIPLIYYGDEMAMTGANDPDNRRDFPAGQFERPGELYEYIAHIAKLRRENDCLRRGELVTLQATDTIYSYSRRSPACEAVIELNLRTKTAEVHITARPAGAPRTH
jgi:glycosidase